MMPPSFAYYQLKTTSVSFKEKYKVRKRIVKAYVVFLFTGFLKYRRIAKRAGPQSQSSALLDHQNSCGASFICRQKSHEVNPG